MTPSKIDIAETTFRNQLTDSSGKKFTIAGKIDLGNGHEIIQLKAAFDSYYTHTATAKTQIFLHFTVGMVTSDIATLSRQDTKVSVSYVVDRQGHIYQLFDPKYWSYHLGGSAVGGNSVLSKQSVGIEISNYGPLKKDGSSFIDAYKNTYTTHPDDVYTIPAYRGYSYFAKMTDIQIDAVCYLIKYLCSTQSIPDTFKDNMGTTFKTAKEATAFKGICCHTDVRTDKFDWPEDIANIIRDRYNALFKKVDEPAPIQPEPVEEQAPVVESQSELETTSDEPVIDTPTIEPPQTDVTQSSNQGLLEILLNLLLSLFKGRFK